MFAKIIVFVALAAIAAAEPCGYLSTGLAGYGLGGCRSKVLNVGCSAPVVSAVPACAPIATPSLVVDPISTMASGLYSSGVYGSGLYGAGAYGAGLYGGCGYGSTLGGCGSTILSTVV